MFKSWEHSCHAAVCEGVFHKWAAVVRLFGAVFVSVPSRRPREPFGKTNIPLSGPGGELARYFKRRDPVNVCLANSFVFLGNAGERYLASPRRRVIANENPRDPNTQPCGVWCSFSGEHSGNS